MPADRRTASSAGNASRQRPTSSRQAKEPLRRRGEPVAAPTRGKRTIATGESSGRVAKDRAKGGAEADKKPGVSARSKRAAQPQPEKLSRRERRAEESAVSAVKKPRRRGFFRRHAKGIAFTILTPPLVVVCGLLWYARGVPLPPDSLSTQTTFLYTDDGQQLGAFRSDTDRTNLTITDIPEVLRNAVLASEDKSFYSHRGVDPLGIGRAIYRDVRNEGVQQGGSTLTQQYVKISYTGRERSYKRKLREAILAIKLERKLTKDEIFERYLNSVYFGRGATGVQAAAKAYFEKDAKDLTLPEAAYLAGVLRAPENTDARRNPERAKFRRDSVLANMSKLGFISETERVAASEVPLTGVGGIVRAKPTSTVNFADLGTDYVVDMVRRELITKFGAAKTFGGGLRVTTTLNLETQRRARAALFDQVLNRKGDPDAAMVVLDHDGHIVALIGGRSWAESQVNLAAGRGYGGLGRQAGSTFKPFVLAAAVREGISIETKFPAPQEVVIPGANVDGTDWTVSNFDDASWESDVDLRTATANSINTVYAQLVTDERVGAERVAEIAKDLGIKSPLDAYPALALGTEEVSPLEMADAYLTFARGGTRVGPEFISKVTDASGQVLFESSTDPTRVLSTDEAAIINQALRAVVDEGSGVKAKLDDGRQVAGKTGTTQNARDAWFVGYTPKNCCVVAVWMGYAKSNAPMTKVHGRRVTGGAFPADVFGRFMNVQVANIDTGEFDEPDANATGEVIEPKLSKKPVTKKKKAPASVVDSVVDTVGPSTEGTDGPVPVGTEPPAPKPDPVPAGDPDSGTDPAPQPEPQPDPEPVQPNPPPAPVDPSPPPVVVDAPLPTLAP